MTRAKNDPRESEKRPYSYAPKRQSNAGCLSVKEIAALFVRAGWLGQLRTPVEYIKRAYIHEVAALNHGKE